MKMLYLLGSPSWKPLPTVVQQERGSEAAGTRTTLTLTDGSTHCPNFYGGQLGDTTHSYKCVPPLTPQNNFWEPILYTSLHSYKMEYVPNYSRQQKPQNNSRPSFHGGLLISQFWNAHIMEYSEQVEWIPSELTGGDL